MFYAFYAVITKTGNLNVLKKQKKKKKGKKKVGNKNGNGAASDSENHPKLLAPLRKLLQTMSVGCADSIKMINGKLDFQKHELDMKNIEASFGIQRITMKLTICLVMMLGISSAGRKFSRKYMKAIAIHLNGCFERQRLVVQWERRF